MIFTIAFIIILLIANLNVVSQVTYGTSSTTYSMYGLSTDTKPASPANNCYFIETNTGNTYKSSGGSWAIVGMGKDTLAGYYMPIQRAADSIAAIKTSIALKTTLALALSGITLSTSGSGIASYNNVSGAFNIPNTTFSTNAKADNSTKGIALFDSSYFNDDGNGLISLNLNYGTGTASANAVTINAPRGAITVSSPSITALTNLSLTLTNSYISSTSTVVPVINSNGSNLPLGVICYVKSKTSGSAVINVLNLSLLSLFTTSLVIDFVIFN